MQGHKLSPQNLQSLVNLPIADLLYKLLLQDPEFGLHRQVNRIEAGDVGVGFAGKVVEYALKQSKTRCGMTVMLIVLVFARKSAMKAQKIYHC